MEITSSKSSILKKPSESLPILSVIVLVLGLLKEYLYYKYFGIDIIPYLSISELGLILFDEIFNVLIMFLIYIVLKSISKESAIFTEYLFKRFSKKIDKKEAPEEKVEFELKITFVPWGFITFITIIFLAIFRNSKTDLQYTLLMVGVLIFGSILSKLDTIIKYIKLNILIIAAYSLGIILYISSVTIHRAKNVSKGSNKGTIITTTDTTYISTDSFYFVGRTNSYYFLKNTKLNSVTVLPSDEVKSFELYTIDIDKEKDRPEVPPKKP